MKMTKPTLECLYYRPSYNAIIPSFLKNSPTGTLVLELYACCIDCHSSNGVRGHCWYSWFLVNGRIEILERPGGQALTMQLQPFDDDP